RVVGGCGGCPAGWVAGPRPDGYRSDRPLRRPPRRELYRVAVVADLERFPVLQEVAGRGVVDLDPQPLPPDEQAERQPGEPLGEARRETERAALLAQAGEAADHRDPRAGQ